jgi:hypothetical protein
MQQYTHLEAMRHDYQQTQRRHRTHMQELETQIQEFQTQISQMQQTQQITNERIKQLTSYEFHNPFHLLLVMEKALLETPHYFTSSMAHRFIRPAGPNHPTPATVRAAAYNLLALIPMALISYIRIVQATFHLIYYTSWKSISIILLFAWQRFLALVGISPIIIAVETVSVDSFISPGVHNMTTTSTVISLEFREHVDLVWFLLMNFYTLIGISILVAIVIVAFHSDESSPVEWQAFWKNPTTTTTTTSAWWRRPWFSSWSSSSSWWSWNTTEAWIWQYQTITSFALAAIYALSFDFTSPFPYTQNQFLGILTVHGFVTLCIPVILARVTISVPAHPNHNPTHSESATTTGSSSSSSQPSQQQQTDASSSSSDRIHAPTTQRFSFLDETATALATGNAMRPLLFALECGALTQYLGFMTCLDGLGLYIFLMHILRLFSKRACQFFKLTGVHFYADGCMSGPFHIVLHLYFVIRLGMIVGGEIPRNEMESIYDNAIMAVQAHCFLNGVYSTLACLGNWIGTVIFQRGREKMAATNAGTVVLGPFHNIVVEGILLCLLWGFSFIVIAVDLLVASGKM